MNTAEQKEHSRFSASSSYRWLVCTGSVKAIESLPTTLQQGKNSYGAREGTVAHALCEMGLKKQNISFQLDKSIDNIPVTTEMLDYVKMYIKYCNKTHKTYIKKYGKSNVSMYVERKQEMSKHFQGESIGGTADCLFVVKGKFIHVVDFKYGKFLVEVENNTQLMLYGLPSIIGKSKKYCKENFPFVKLTIVQPRAYHKNGIIRTTNIKSTKLLRWAKHVVKPSIKQAVSGDSILTPGEKQCLWCLKSGDCKAQSDFIVRTAQHEFSAEILKKPIKIDGLTNKQIHTILSNKRMIINWLSSVEHHATSKLEQGGKLKKYYKLVAKNAHRKFTVCDERLKGFMIAHGVETELLYEGKRKSPNQLEQVLKSKVGVERAKKLMHTVSEKPLAGVTIVERSDERPEFVGSAQQEFSNINQR